MTQSPTNASSSRRRGAVAVLTVVSLMTLLALASLAVDVGYICSLAADQQNTADAGALAGASGLQDDTWEEGRVRAYEIISRNQRLQAFSSMDDQLIQFGRFDFATNTFLPSDDRDDAFACRVLAVRPDAQLFFAALAGHSTTTVKRQAVAIGSKPCGGIWGINGVRVPGNVETDSYNSTDGPYSPGTALSNGDICSGRGIRVMGSVLIDGDVMVGLDYAVGIAGQPEITGVTTSQIGAGIQMPAVEFGDIAVNNDNDTIPLTAGGNEAMPDGVNLVVKGSDSLTLLPGNYLFENVKFGANSTLTLTGPTNIYVTGSFDITGSGTINTTMNPADLNIYSTGDSIKLTGDVEFYGSILAPYAEVDLGGGSSYYGALVGGFVTMHGDFQFHVDESLPLAQPLWDPPPPFLVK